ncbi:low-density lipoprotein receptor-related protein 8-like isoform X2 [Rhinatrema bivittatum]|uniref:low-density lipoprotein receptor-related protein 8-like isoform X2 n=1 Tax=Rhinatrema bivittatum TaxID=194408 RepID=UPI00112B97B2|nr:low-density lipoprotein receptor-related protein 8-like isoform X2 [Rhinatrema bivittatum]
MDALPACWLLAEFLCALLASERGVSGSPVTTCLSRQYACRTGRCIPAIWRCDGDEDCEDGSDEAECREAACSGFLCSNGQCIEKKWRCDGEAECEDGSDERPEMCGKGNATCTSAQFHCRNAECVPRALVCDGKDDCGDNSDESSCPSPGCRAQEFRCLTAGLCLPAAVSCDGKEDCPDGSDESPGRCRAWRPLPCADSEFQCAPGHCVPDAWKCDGHTDCENGADEAECDDRDADATGHPLVRWEVAAAFLGLVLLTCLVLCCIVQRKWSRPMANILEVSKEHLMPMRTGPSSSSYTLADRRTRDGED